jgi:hypothetical protein
MNLIRLLSLISTVLSVAFASMVLWRWTRRRRPYLLLWGIGLILYGIGTFADFYSTIGWSPLVFRLWYLTGALLAAAYLGQGTIYLLVRKPYLANSLMILLGLGTLAAMILVFRVPLDGNNFSMGIGLSEQYKEILPSGATVRKLTPFFNIYGTLALGGGAIYSAWIFWRKRVLLNRALGNVFIAVGALSPALGGTFTRFGHPEYLSLALLLGVILMFVGFLFTTRHPAQVPRRQVTTSVKM